MTGLYKGLKMEILPFCKYIFYWVAMLSVTARSGPFTPPPIDLLLRDGGCAVAPGATSARQWT